MSFLSPLWLLLAGLAAAVIALHMFRRRQVEVPSTLVWRLLAQEGRTRQRLHPPKLSLPLLLQVVIVVLIAVTLAQPLFGSGAAQKQHIVYVLDSSGSMRSDDVTPSRFEAAVKDIAARISASSADAGHRISIISVGGRAKLIAARQADATAAATLLGDLSASDGLAAWDEVPSLLDAVIKSDEATSIVIATDGGDEAVAALDTAFPDVAVERRVITGAEFANAGLLAQLSPAEGPVNSWKVDGTVTFSGPAAKTTVTVAFKPENGQSFLQWTDFDVTAPTGGEGGATEVRFSQIFVFPSAGILSLALREDSGPQDNEQSFVLRSTPRALRVLYLGDGNIPVEQALLAMPGVSLFAGDELPSDDQSFDLIVADGVTLSRAPKTNVLWVGTARLAGEAEPAVLTNPLPTGWADDHPLSAEVDWSRVRAEQAYGFAPLASATVLLQAGDVPLVQARTITAGREVRLAMSLETGNWQDIPGFPIFIHNLIGWLGAEPGALVDPICIAGTPCPLEARYLSAPVFSPSGERLRMPSDNGGGWLLAGEEGFVPQRAGLYGVGEGAEAVTLAVNAPAGETDLAPRVASSNNTVSGINAVNLDIWWWVAAAILVLLVAEAILVGRGAEQFMSLRALRRGMPLAGRRRWMLGLRLGAVTATIAAMLLLPLPVMKRSEDVVLIVDPVFQGGDTHRDTLLAGFMDKDCDADGGLGLVALGNIGKVAADMGCGLPAQSAVAGGLGGANVGDALETAAAMMAPGQKGRIILATDGNETVGDLARAIPSLNARGIMVDVVPLHDMSPNDVFVQSVQVPPHVYEGDVFPINTIVFSNAGTKARITVTADGTVIDEKQVDLLAGQNHVETVVGNPRSGTVRYEVAVRAPDDPTPENDRNGAMVSVAAGPRIAVITPQTAWGGYFAEALGVQGLTAEVMEPSLTPVSMEDWLDYDAVVLMNVPAIQLDTRQQQQIEQLVRLHGRGLMILGGENSFGPGGYYQTPLEDVSPLSSRVPKEEPVGAIVFVIDRSGSMTASVGGISRLDIAKQATADAIELLTEDTEVGVVMFNSTADAVIPLQPRKMVTGVAQTLAPLKPLGGTSLVAAVDEALNQLEDIDAPIRHIVAMSDGLSQPMAFETILQRALDMDVTLSIVAIGDVADMERLADVAGRGGGAFHHTGDFRALPSIMSQEAMMLTGAPVEKRTAAAIWVNREDSFLAGLPAELPPIQSYVRTTAKPQAHLHMAVEEDDGTLTPILASWTYGNGHVLSLATHGAGPGTLDWSEMKDYPLLWAQPLRHFLSAVQGPGLHVSLDRSGDEVLVDVGLLDRLGRPVSDASLMARLNRSGEASGAGLDLREVAPGHYQGRSAVDGPGLYDVAVSAGDEHAVASIDITYPARFDFSRTGVDKLGALSRATGGQVLNGDEPILSNQKDWSAQPSWQPWLLLALALLLGDLVLRYAPGLFNGVRPRGFGPSLK